MVFITENLHHTTQPATINLVKRTMQGETKLQEGFIEEGHAKLILKCGITPQNTTGTLLTQLLHI